MTLAHVWLTILLRFICVLSSPTFDNPNPRVYAPLASNANPQDTINGSYIVVLKDHAVPLLSNHLKFVERIHAPQIESQGYGIKQVYDGFGYSGRFTSETLGQIRQQPEVEFIEADQLVRIFDLKVQENAPWNLARISHRKTSRKQGGAGVDLAQDPGANGEYLGGTRSKANSRNYQYDGVAGSGITVYVVDTGVNVHHQEFEGRAEHGTTIPSGENDEDMNGHGTHCAGVVAGRTYGVAKKAKIKAVKVLDADGGGSLSDVIAGIDWVKKDYTSRLRNNSTGNNDIPAVASLSLGGGKSRALDGAVNKAVDAGIVFVVAAGNDSEDACGSSPAAAEKAITVAASTEEDEQAYFSNYGPCVDIFAPGVDILSSFAGRNDATATLSGTSMATPHVAGLAAYFISLLSSEYSNGNASHSTATSSPSGAPLNQTDLWGQNAYQSFNSTRSHTLMFTGQGKAATRDRFWAHKRILGVLEPHKSGDATQPGEQNPKTPRIAPAEIKSHILTLANQNELSGVSSDTPNALAYNNATS